MESEITSFHTVPRNDLRRHTCNAEGKCWCKPVHSNEDDPEARVPSYSHNSADRRERHEYAHDTPISADRSWGIVWTTDDDDID